MQSTETSISNINSVFDYYPTFTAWEHNEQPSVSLKLLNRNLSFLQNQYKIIRKRQQPGTKELMTNIWQRKSQSKVSFFEENLVRLPEVKKYKRGQSIGSLVKSDKQNINTRESRKKTSNPLNCLRGVDKKIVQKRRSGSQFSQLREYLKGEVNEKDIFLHKNRIANISKTINLKTSKQSYYLKQQSFDKPSRLDLVRKIQKVMQVRS